MENTKKNLMLEKIKVSRKRLYLLVILILTLCLFLSYEFIRDPYLVPLMGTQFQNWSNRVSVQKFIHETPNEVKDVVPNKLTYSVPNKLIDGVPNKLIDGVSNNLKDAVPNKLIDGVSNNSIDAISNKLIDGVPNKLIDALPNKIIHEGPINLTQDISNKTVKTKAERGTKLFDTETSLNSSYNIRNNRALLNNSVEDSKSGTLPAISKDIREGEKNDIHDSNKGINIQESKKNNSVLRMPSDNFMIRMISQSHNKSWKDNLDLLKLKPFKFLPNYKNPCWKTHNLSVPISCLPYFYLVGAPKAGTTDVFTRLQAHPDFAKPSPKEPHWLTRGRFRPVSSSIYYYSHYYFRRSSNMIYRTRDDNGYHRLITGDCSASTFFDNFNWRMLPHPDNAQEPEHTNADYVHHINPNARIIVMLRDPVSRLYSDFLYINKNASQSSFHNAVTRVIEWLHQCQETYSLRSCVYDKRGFQLEEPMARIQIGIYHIHLQEFFRVFPRDQILIFKLEDYSKSPEEAMKKIFKFLDLSDSAKLKLEILQNTQRNANERREKDKEKGQMWKITQDLLRDFHKPHNDALAKLLQDDHFNYNNMYS